MRLLLTSAGLRTGALVDALRDLLGRPTAESRVVVLPTAFEASDGDHGWALDDLVRLRDLGWREFSILPLDGLPRALILERLRAADVVYAEGGNHYALAHGIIAGGFADELRELLDRVVWVGVSAGSMIFGRAFTDHAGEILGDLDDRDRVGVDHARSPFDLVDWYVKPHLGSPDFPERDAAWADRLAGTVDFPLYLLDDDSAVQVTGDRGQTVQIISTSGAWRFIDPSRPR